MEEYEDKINRNFKAKLRNVLCNDGVCVYIPNLEMKNIIEKASVEFYLPVTDREEAKEAQNASFYGHRQSNEAKKNGSNSLDSKLHDFSYHPVHGQRPVTDFTLP